MPHFWFLVTLSFTLSYPINGGSFWMYPQKAQVPAPINTHYEVLPSDSQDKSDKLVYFESDSQDEKEKVNESRSDIDSYREKTLPLFLARFLSILKLNRDVRELETSSISPISCVMCNYGIGVLKYFLASGATEDDLAEKAENFCIELHIESEDVCRGIINSFKHEIYYVFGKSNFSLYEICSGIVGDSCGGKHALNWSIVLPSVVKPPIKNVLLSKSNSPVLKVLHLSDTHFDMYYKENVDTECGKPLCCRIGDKIVNSSRGAGKWGDYRKCDTPLRTIENMFDHISKNFKIDYILWTGDLPPHDIWNQSRSDQIYVLKQTTKLFLKYFPNIPVFPALGNHESTPVNSFPPPFIKGNDSISWLYDELINAWANWLPNYTTPTIKKGAFYSVLVSTGFRIISLNLNYCNNKNWWLLLNSTDPAEELQWLVYELQYAELKNEKVHIIGHIPPGCEDCLKVWSGNFYKIINRFENTVTAQFYGHTHFDEFQIFYDETDVTRPTNVAYIGPSVTPFTSLNPAFRIYTVDGFYENSSFTVLDIDNYMMDLRKANQNEEMPEWVKLYSAKDAYKMNALQPKDWDKLAKQMMINPEIFEKYFQYYHRASPVFPACEDKKCKFRLLCAMISAKSHDSSQCSHLKQFL